MLRHFLVKRVYGACISTVDCSWRALGTVQLRLYLQLQIIALLLITDPFGLNLYLTNGLLEVLERWQLTKNSCPLYLNLFRPRVQISRRVAGALKMNRRLRYLDRLRLRRHRLLGFNYVLVARLQDLDGAAGAHRLGLVVGTLGERGISLDGCLFNFLFRLRLGQFFGRRLERGVVCLRLKDLRQATHFYLARLMYSLLFGSFDLHRLNQRGLIGPAASSI